MNNLELRLPPPLIMLANGLLMWLLAKAFPELSVTGSAQSWAPPLLVVLGLAIGLSGIVAFIRSQTTANPKRPGDASKLVQSGIYRYSRNPMYLGMLFLLIAWALYLGNLIAVVGLIGYIAYITRFQIMPEERALQEKFQEDFLNYKKTVRRWL